ncbi:hypothetical protein PIB30_085860 [Stylosanthes scabra]|uniref:Uncharacterized protein n=1 Tax=Stylosanthes scabra TaxID=79078 RepID=A0ABU6ZRK7_9FABA|nr:hypothetical protein [Stylosanthes scabra]
MVDAMATAISVDVAGKEGDRRRCHEKSMKGRENRVVLGVLRRERELEEGMLPPPPSSALRRRGSVHVLSPIWRGHRRWLLLSPCSKRERDSEREGSAERERT